MILEPFHPLCDRHAAYVQKMPNQICADTRGFVAVDKNLKVEGAVIFDNFLPNSAQAAIQVTNPLCLRYNGLLTEACYYFYDIAARQIMYALVRESNEEALQLDYKIGFKHEHFLPQAFEDDEGVHILSMRKEDCKYYNPELNRRAA